MKSEPVLSKTGEGQTLALKKEKAGISEKTKSPLFDFTKMKKLKQAFQICSQRPKPS